MYRMAHSDRRNEVAIVTSEPLTDVVEVGRGRGGRGRGNEEGYRLGTGF